MLSEQKLSFTVRHVMCTETAELVSQAKCHVRQVLDDPTLSEQKRTGHLAAIRREVDVMRKLRGTLNVACFEDAYEDDEHVHIVMEWCRGGELHHRIGDKHYSERTVCCFVELPPLPAKDIAAQLSCIVLCRLIGTACRP